MSAQTCPDCGASYPIDDGRGNYVCTSCGLVCEHSDFVSVSHEDFQSENSRFSIELRRGFRESEKPFCKQLREAAQDSFPRNIINTACAILEDAASGPAWKQRKHGNHGGILAAAMYHACEAHRQYMQPRDICEALPMLATRTSNINRMVKNLETSSQKIKRRNNTLLSGRTPGIEYIPRYLKMFGCWTRSIEDDCRKMYRANRKYLENHHPATIAACVLVYFIREDKIAIPESHVMELCAVTRPTINGLLNALVAT